MSEDELGKEVRSGDMLDVDDLQVTVQQQKEDDEQLSMYFEHEFYRETWICSTGAYGTSFLLFGNTQ